MSRMPPIPSASRPAYGPEAVAKDFDTDLSHHTDLPFQRHHRSDIGGPDTDTTASPSRQDRSEPVRPGDDLGGMVPRHGGQGGSWMLIAFGLVVAAIVWLAGRQGRTTA